jgi:hypothetical protein
MNPLLDDFGGGESRRRQCLTEPEARLAKFYAEESKSTHREGLADKLVQAHSAGDEVAPARRQPAGSLMPDARLITDVEVAIAADAGACNNVHPLLIDLLLALGRTDEDAFNHLVLVARVAVRSSEWRTLALVRRCHAEAWW